MPATASDVRRVIGTCEKAGDHPRLRTLTRLAPLLIVYAFIFLVVSRPTLDGDEPRYAEFAAHLTHGYYSDRHDVNLFNGPGYPLVLAPFVALHLPWRAIKAVNVFFLFGAAAYFYATLNLYLNRDLSTRFTYVLGLTPPFMAHIHLLYTESFATLLVCAFAYHLCKLSSSPRSNLASLLAAAAALAWLALTKVIIGYVILALLVPYLVYLVFDPSAPSRRLCTVYGLALLFCVPYLVYTYSLTGRIFYWANSGGSTLYWISTPYPGELGDWNGYTRARNNMPLAPEHEAFFATIRSLPSIQQDDELRRKGLQQITEHPRKALQNWAANVGRLLFSYPYSFTNQKLSTYFYIVPNMFIVVLSLLLLYPSAVRIALIPCEISWLMCFAGLAFGASSLLSAYERQFQILVPIVLLWVFFSLTNVVKISLRG
jgi:hypothetical protein